MTHGVVRTRNPWVRFVVASYWGRRLPQLAELERVAIGYPTDEADYYAQHPRVTFRDTLIRCSPEWRAQKGQVMA